MGELLALAAAICFGANHFLGGMLSRRASSSAVALTGQVGGTVVAAAIAVVVPASHVSFGALGWGALSGLGTGVGVSCLYRGMSRGNLSVVVPLSDVAGVALPLVTGVVLLGNRPAPLAWCGIAVAVPALWLVSRRKDSSGLLGAKGAPDGLVAGAGFALQFIAIAQADPAAGLWPIVVARVASVAVIGALAPAMGATLRLRARLVLPALGVGTLGTGALILYTLATHRQLLAIAVVLAALYPAIPVLLGLTLLRERLSRGQTVGLVAAGVAIVFIAIG